MLGAYGCAMRTGFNGFGVEDRVIVDDEPMAIALRTPRNASRGVERRHAVRHSHSACVMPAKAGILSYSWRCKDDRGLTRSRARMTR